MLMVNWLREMWKIRAAKYPQVVCQTQNCSDMTNLRPLTDHCELLHHVKSEWNKMADALTHEARVKGSCWLPCNGRQCALRACFDGRCESQ